MTTPSSLLAYIRENSRDGVAPTCNGKSWLSRAAKKHFGGWPQACHAAGMMTHAEARSMPKVKKAPQRRTIPTEVRPAVRAVSRAVSFARQHGVTSGDALLLIAREMYGGTL